MLEPVTSEPQAAEGAARGRPRKLRLGEILLGQNVLSGEALARALDAQKRTGRKLGRVLIELGLASEESISHALSRQFNIPYVDLQRFQVPQDAARYLSEAQARRLRALGLGETAHGVRVAMADPTDLSAYDELERILKRELELVVVTESALLSVLDRIYRRSSEITGLAEELGRNLGESEGPVAGLGLTASAEDVPVARLLQSIFEDAIRSRASDVHLEPQEQSLQVRFRIDGVLHVQAEAEARIAGAVALRLKLIASLDISEKRLPQDGRFQIKVRNVPVDVRISTMPTPMGESIAMRLLVRSGDTRHIDGLGLPDWMLDRLRSALSHGNGMILATGPTGSGKSTTLYAALSEVNSPERKIITVEDPIEYRLPGITQVQVHEKIELTFARVLRSVLRHDPDVVLVGEMRDAETVETGLRAAMTGHLVFSTLHTNDAASTPVRLIDMGAPAFMVALSLRLVIAQRLIRVVCEACAEPAQPTATEMEWLEQELGPVVAAAGKYRFGRGCPHCNGTGYHGRSGLYEMLEMTPALVEAATHEDARVFMTLAAEQMAGRTLGHYAAELVAAGRTTADEALRAASVQND